MSLGRDYIAIHSSIISYLLHSLMSDGIFLSSYDVAINCLFHVSVILDEIFYFLCIGVSNSLIRCSFTRGVIPYLLYAFMTNGIFGCIGILDLLSNMWGIIYSWLISYLLIYLLRVSVSNGLVCCIFTRGIISYLLHSFMTNGVFRNRVLCTLTCKMSGLVKLLFWLVYHYLGVNILDFIVIVIIVLRLSLFMAELVIFLRLTIWAHNSIPIGSLINSTIVSCGSTRLILAASSVFNLIFFFRV